jgi:integrase
VWQLFAQDFRDKPRMHTIADLVMNKPDSSSESGDGAYQAVNRALKRIGRDLELEGRVHLHRLRRTVAVQALRETENIRAVQELLGHGSANTTMRYVDEARPEALAGLQQKLRTRFTK